MSASNAVEIIKYLNNCDINLHVDGGWGVDALLNHQTREHEDLDIAIKHSDTPKLRKVLANRGFEEIPWGDTWECNYVLDNKAGLRVDVHSYVFDEDGQFVFGCEYRPESLTGNGKIDGFEVECIEPLSLVNCHTGYEFREKDHMDVWALCERFNIEVPEDHRHYKRNA